MSALPPKANISRRDLNVRFVPIADINFSYSIALRAQFMSGLYGSIQTSRWRKLITG
jgi:hypothetical protein